ncbi:phage antirepressor KilAC domain-containing protein [Endozoicomonas sp. GU-1]|uniref:phage antirepressor KilAC domain-containing protein n=1 Tax=Endozoicomonas sp. GU-1 TaxID=3009078 RepID=UPI0022B31A5D|nr:phage antirepressor KilAC domain-containing protein [Endozoicomonas sp. GU-1]WBA79581.1 phage antirepressor KilAC domain-containing protein [Endozoicomonas sp. GU-1]
MNQLTVMSASVSEQTMSSREIAEIVESRHDSVKRTIERLSTKGVVSFTPLVETLNQGAIEKAVTNYYVNKRDSYVVVAQLSPEFTARLVDRWQELEARQIFQLPDFTNPAEAARAWADEMEAKQIAILRAEKAEIQIQRDRPKVVFAENVKASSNSIDVTEAAKRLNVGRNKLYAWLRDQQVLTLKNLPRQCFIDSGKMEVETYSYQNGKEETMTTSKAMFTPKGFVWLEKQVRERFKAA